MVSIQPDDSALIQKVTGLLNDQAYADALTLVHDRLQQSIDISIASGALLKAQLAGLLIDIGAEGRIEKAIRDGIEICLSDRASFLAYIAEGNLEYNLGNAKISLFTLKRLEPQYRHNLESVGLLTEAKNHYWRAYKLLTPSNQEIWVQLLVNLGNTLSTSSRIAEALQYYDLALQYDPNFAEALGNRSRAVIWC
jgi:tetratricopeptide (TPR) repeat protein